MNETTRACRPHRRIGERHGRLPPKLSVGYTVAPHDVPGSLQFSDSLTANENQGTATITVTRTGGSVGSVSVNYATSNGTATAGNDYTAASGTLSFADGEMSKTFTIPIIEDTLVENDEAINLTLSSPTGGAALGSLASASLVIVSDDVAHPGVLQFSTSSYTVNETQSTATITVTRTGGSNVPVAVNYATSNGSATAGSDYTASSGTLNFAPGETSKTFTIPILNDALVELDGRSIWRSAVRGGVMAAATATLTIVSEDTTGTIASTLPGVNGYTGTTDASITTQTRVYGRNGLTNLTSSTMGLYQTSGSGDLSSNLIPSSASAIHRVPTPLTPRLSSNLTVAAIT